MCLRKCGRIPSPKHASDRLVLPSSSSPLSLPSSLSPPVFCTAHPRCHQTAWRGLLFPAGLRKAELLFFPPSPRPRRTRSPRKRYERLRRVRVSRSGGLAGSKLVPPHAAQRGKSIPATRSHGICGVPYPTLVGAQLDGFHAEADDGDGVAIVRCMLRWGSSRGSVDQSNQNRRLGGREEGGRERGEETEERK